MFGSGYENCPEFAVLIDKGVAILDLPMILFLCRLTALIKLLVAVQRYTQLYQCR
jgi:hypothetical protein